MIFHLFDRVCVRPSCLKTIESSTIQNDQMAGVAQGLEPCSKQPVQCLIAAERSNLVDSPMSAPFDSNTCLKVSDCEEESSVTANNGIVRKDPEDVDMICPELCSSVSNDSEVVSNGHSNPEEMDAVVNHTPRMVSGFASLSEMSPTEVQSPKCRSAFSPDVQEGGRAKSTCADEVMSLASSTKNYVPMQNGACGRAETPDEVSVAPMSTIKETLDETTPVSSEDLAIAHMENLEKNKSKNDLPSSRYCADNDRAKLTGQNSSSDTKLKPLFSPGFLGKRSRNKSTITTAVNVSSSCNGFSKAGLPYQISGELKNEAKALSNCSDFPSSSFVGNQPEKSPNEDEMVSTEFNESVIPCHEDSNFITTNGSCNNSTMGDAEEIKGKSRDCSINNGLIYSMGNPSADKLLAIDGGVHERDAITYSGVTGTKSKNLAE